MSSFTVGCRVRVLRGRHFADFEEGDEGTVLDINTECRNCTVVFDCSQARIKVALKHLRLISQRAEGRTGAPYADGVDTSSPTALATKMAQEMRLADAASVKALEAQAEDLRSRLAAATHRADASEAMVEKQQQELLAKADDIAKLSEQLQTSYEEGLQTDLAVARLKAREEKLHSELEQAQRLCEQRVSIISDMEARNRQLEKQLPQLQKICNEQANELVVQRDCFEESHKEEMQAKDCQMQELCAAAQASAERDSTTKIEELARAEVRLDKQQLELVAKANDIARLKEELQMSRSEGLQGDLVLTRAKAREEKLSSELEEAKQLCGQRGALALDYEAQLHLSELKMEEVQKSCNQQMQELSMQRQLSSSLQLQLEDEERKSQTSSQLQLEVRAKDLEIQSLRSTNWTPCG